MTTKKSAKKKPAKRDASRRVANDILHGLKAMVAELQGGRPLPVPKHVVNVRRHGKP